MESIGYSRRQALKRAVLGVSAVVVAGPGHIWGAEAVPAAGPYALPPLPYAFDALEPHIDAQTMQIHHGKHHAAYVSNLNKAVGARPELAKRAAEDLVRDLGAIPEDIRGILRNHGGGHVNHSLFWQILGPKGGGEPRGNLRTAVEKQFGSFDAFREQLTKAAVLVFGSGWAWLSLDTGGQLRVEATPNQDSPLSQGRTPILGIDVWEHAYYLKYQNRRPDYVAAFFNVINWEAVAERHSQAVGSR